MQISSCFGKLPDSFNKGLTQLIFIYYIENILEQVIDFHFLEFLFLKEFTASKSRDQYIFVEFDLSSFLKLN